MESSAETSPPAFFVADGDLFVPTDRSRGPWDAESLHGRVIAGLLAHQVEAHHAAEDFVFARFTVDMFRVAPYRPVAITTSVARDGNRIKVVDATMLCDGVEVARASAVLLRKSDEPHGRVWNSPEPPMVEPLSASVRERPAPTERDLAWDTRIVGGGFGTGERMEAWLRQLCPTVAGADPSPFVRAAGASDFAHPTTNSGDSGLSYINADITLYLHRPPVGEWFGFRSLSHENAEGVAVGEAAVFDEAGAVGRATVCGITNRRR